MVYILFSVYNIISHNYQQTIKFYKLNKIQQLKSKGRKNRRGRKNRMNISWSIGQSLRLVLSFVKKIQLVKTLCVPDFGPCQPQATLRTFAAGSLYLQMLTVFSAYSAVEIESTSKRFCDERAVYKSILCCDFRWYLSGCVEDLAVLIW